jgi:hypothetical protein
VVDDQHAEHTENRDRNRNLQRRTTASAQTIFRQILRHPKIRVGFLWRNQIPATAKVPPLTRQSGDNWRGTIVLAVY